MAKTYKLDKKINDILLSSLRMVNGYSDVNGPDSEKLEETLSAFQDIVNHLEARGFKLFKKVWRERVLNANSNIQVGSNYYRCYKQHTVPTISTWTADTAYLVDEYVYPTVYNGFYYICSEVVAESDSKTGAVEPTFLAQQNEETTDNNVVWKAIPDSKPEVGFNFRTYWILDTTLNSGDAYTTGTTFYSSGCFSLQDDELYISNAYISSNDDLESDLEIIGSDQYEKLTRKYDRGDPYYLNIEQIDIYDRMAHLYPIPKTVGMDGDILHYETTLKIADNTESTESTGFIDSYFRFLKFCLTADIAAENGVDWQQNIYLDKKAEVLFKELKAISFPKTTTRRMSSCYTRS